MMRALVLAALVVPTVAACGSARARVEVLPVVNPNTFDVSCCVAYVEVPPSTQVSVQVTHSDDAGTKVKLGAHWRF